MNKFLCVFNLHPELLWESLWEVMWDVYEWEMIRGHMTEFRDGVA